MFENYAMFRSLGESLVERKYSIDVRSAVHNYEIKKETAHGHLRYVSE